MNCPKCKSRATGRIGQGQYYCWDCSIEFEPTPAGVRVYRLEPDGIAIPESIDGSPVSGSTSQADPRQTLDCGVNPGELQEAVP